MMSKSIFLLKSTFLGGMLAMTAMMSSATAAVIDIDSFDNGHYDQFGDHTSTNKNTITGQLPEGTFDPRSNNASWYAFDLSSVSGPVTGASITFYANGYYSSFDSSETFQLRDYSGDIADLIAGGTGLTAIYDDLNNGDIYGSHVYMETGGLFTDMVEFTIALSLDALADINDALLADGQFALGGIITSQSTQPGSIDVLFSSSGQATAAFLTLDVADVSRVAEPAPLALLGLGLIGFGLVRRRRR